MTFQLHRINRICKLVNLLTCIDQVGLIFMWQQLCVKQVSHHPTVVACHCEGRGWRFWADSNIRSKFWGRSIQLDPMGLLTLEFDDGEIFQWSKV